MFHLITYFVSSSDMWCSLQLHQWNYFAKMCKIHTHHFLFDSNSIISFIPSGSKGWVHTWSCGTMFISKATSNASCNDFSVRSHLFIHLCAFYVTCSSVFRLSILKVGVIYEEYAKKCWKNVKFKMILVISFWGVYVYWATKCDNQGMDRGLRRKTLAVLEFRRFGKVVRVKLKIIKWHHWTCQT